jgi:hypothetical protein
MAVAGDKLTPIRGEAQTVDKVARLVRPTSSEDDSLLDDLAGNCFPSMAD